MGTDKLRCSLSFLDLLLLSQRQKDVTANVCISSLTLPRMIAKPSKMIWIRSNASSSISLISVAALKNATKISLFLQNKNRVREKKKKKKKKKPGWGKKKKKKKKKS